MRILFLLCALLTGCASGQKIVDTSRNNIPEQVTPALDHTPYAISLGAIFFVVVLACVYYLLKTDSPDSSD